jgi:hypothetical protein
MEGRHEESKEGEKGGQEGGRQMGEQVRGQAKRVGPRGRQGELRAQQDRE